MVTNPGGPNPRPSVCICGPSYSTDSFHDLSGLNVSRAGGSSAVFGPRFFSKTRPSGPIMNVMMPDEPQLTGQATVTQILSDDITHTIDFLRTHSFTTV